MKQLDKVKAIVGFFIMVLLSVACGPAGSESTTQTLFVGAEQVDCVGVAPQRCLLVKENAESEYVFFYDAIEGFEWEEGHKYELLVEVTEIDNPPADGSSLQYRLIEVVDKAAVDVSQ